VTEEIKARQTAEGLRSGVEFGQRADTGAASRNGGTESMRPRFNRYIYENLLCHVEGQIEHWNQMAVRQSNPEAAHTLWEKAEGLGYALRLLYAFQPEFKDLVAAAERATCAGCGAALDKRPYQPAADGDLCDSCYEIGRGDETLPGDRTDGLVCANDFTAPLRERSDS